MTVRLLSVAAGRQTLSTTTIAKVISALFHQKFARMSLAKATMAVSWRRAAARVNVTVGAGPWRQQLLPAAAAWRARRMSSAAPEEEPSRTQSREQEPEPVLVYEGPMARAVRLMKGVSVTSCALTSVGMPTLCVISEQSASMVGKVGIHLSGVA